MFQAARVQEMLAKVQASRGGPAGSEVVAVSTTGDRLGDAPLSQLGGRGVFVKEVQTAVLEGRADLAVHSAKDLTPLVLEGLVLAAVPERADPRDVLVGATLDDLGPGAMVATGAVRRRAQLAALRPDLTWVDLRGNIATRLDRVPSGGAVVMALAALNRLGLEGRVADVLPVSVMLPQVGQGALAVECREDDAEVAALLAEIDEPGAARCLAAERAFLAALGGSCDMPVAALAVPAAEGPTGSLVLEAMVASGDGRVLVRRLLSGDRPEELGRAMATLMCDEAGLRETLDMEVEGRYLPGSSR